jgi:PEP-CTERM motif
MPANPARRMNRLLNTSLTAILFASFGGEQLNGESDHNVLRVQEIIMKMYLAVALALTSSLAAAPASAVGLLGQSFSYCTNSVFAGAVTLNPSACDPQAAGAAGTATVADPLVEVISSGTGTRTVDFSNATITVTYGDVSSFSPDLYVFTGFSGITGLTLASADPLGISTIFNGTSIGLLVGSPLERGTVVFNVTTGGMGAVPEPASWAMLLIGFGAVGTAMRTTKRRQTA